MNKKRSNRTPFLFAIGLLVFFGAFIAWLIWPSEFDEARKELSRAKEISEVKSIWQKHQSELGDSPDFYQLIIKTIANFKLSQKTVEEVFSWLPDNRPQYLNLVVVPDLSSRIKDNVNNPEQIKNDTTLIFHIYDTFSGLIKNVVSPKDRLMVAVTDNDQARGDFGKIANQLIIDPKKKKANVRTKDFLSQLRAEFRENIINLYGIAKVNPSGADYWFYFNQKVKNHEIESSLFEKYQNKLIIITDGYFEVKKPYQTELVFNPNATADIKSGMNPDDVLKKYKATIQRCLNTNLKDWRILMLEINEREPGKNTHYPILKEYWADWFESMGYRDLDRENFFVLREDATQITKAKIEKFIR